MKLTDKLRRFAAEPKSAQTQEQTADLAFLQGQVVTNPFGSYYLIERTFALADRHGHLQLGQILEINPPNLALAAKDEAVNQLQLEQTLLTQKPPV